MTGEVDGRGTPVIRLDIAGQTWTAIIDTGFDGFVHLPSVLASEFKSRLWGEADVTLSNGQIVRQKLFILEFPFDGELQTVRASFGPGHEVLIGTQLLAAYRVEINFATRAVLLEKVETT
jgi:predicted aspartyl protease